jgi:hypothetical protein
MINKTTATLVMACVSLYCSAQSDSVTRTAEHYVGLQANQLLRQLLNFSGNASGVNNPYLINYSVVESSSKMGVNIGFGYNIDQAKTGDITNERDSKTNELFLRVGFEKKMSLSKRWLLGLGADVLLQKEKSETTSKTIFGNGKSVINTTSNQNGFGGGPRCTLSYFITNRILIGTEATYYFKSLTSKGKVVSAITNLEFDPNTGEQVNLTRTEATKTDDTFKQLQFSVPTVIWLIVKF